MSTTSDVLTEIAARCAFEGADGERILLTMVRWLEKQLLADQYARLGQAGHDTDRKLPLAQVFVDLEVEQEGAGADEKAPMIVAELLGAEPAAASAAERVAAESVAGHKRRAKRRRRASGRYLVIGGPGQGKSTMGQFLCQLHRATLLRGWDGTLSPVCKQVVDAVLNQRAAVGLHVTAPLFPVRIELSRLAAWLSQQPQQATLLSFLAAQVERLTQKQVGPDELRRWLMAHPFLLVLDGLDEAPISAGRALMLEALHGFWAQMGELRSVVLVTTRPQGYGNELADYAPRRLAALSPERALAYAGQLVASWFPQSEDEAAELMARLHKAAAENSPAQTMMRSPLQVTIMATLLQRVENPPQERWELFERYYQVVYDREMGKHGAAPELRANRPHIDAIHRRVGLLLQVESERASGMEALLTRARLREVIETTLAVQRVRGDRGALTERLLRLATDRLVFLVEPRDGRFGFEVRSLQEFMAAKALADGSDEDVRQRVLQVAAVAAWRNVIAFLLSRAIHDLSSHWRPWLADDLCRLLNEAPGDDLARTTLAGSQLALDLLMEKGALRDPVCSEPLLAHALGLLTLPPSERHLQLAGLAAWADDGLAQIGLELLKKAIPGRPGSGGLGAWVVLIELIERGFAWARALGEECWSSSEAEQREVVAVVELVYRRSLYDLLNDIPRLLPIWILERMAQAPMHFGPEDWSRIRDQISWRREQRPVWVNAVLDLDRWGMGTTTLRDATGALIQSVVLSSQPLLAKPPERAAIWSLLAEAQLPPRWMRLVWVARFAAQPVAAVLAQALRGIADLGWSVEDEIPSVTPWPLALCLDGAPDAASLRGLAAQAVMGELGDTQDWIHAEVRWQRDGVGWADWEEVKRVGVRPHRGLAQAGIPNVAWIGIPQPYADEQPVPAKAPTLVDLIAPLLQLYRIFPLCRSRCALARFIMEHLSDLPSQSQEDLSESLRAGLFEDAVKHHTYLGVPLPRWMLDATADTNSVLDMLAHCALSMPPSCVLFDEMGVLAERVTRRYRENPNCAAPLRILVALAAGPDTTVLELPEELLQAERFADPIDRICVAILRLRSDLEVSDDIAADCSLPETKEWADVFLGTVSNIWHAISDSLRHTFYLSLLQHLPATSWQFAARAQEGLLPLLRSRPSGLDLPATWDRLHLPPPRPEPPRGYSAPVQLRAVTLRNLRCFAELTIAVQPRPPEAGGWLVLVGENGVGKTTVLRALALTCLDPAIATAVLTQMREQSRVPMLQNSNLPGECVLTLRDGTLRALLTHRGDHEAVSQAEDSPPRPLLYAYGSRRGSALGGPDRDLALGPLADVNTLFDGREGLIHGETWLKNRKLAAMQHKGGLPEHIYDAIIAVLLKLLPGVTEIDVRDDRVWVSGPAIGASPLGGLSDGYLSTAGWVLDLLARYLDRAQQRGWQVDPDFPARLEGLVLIDEVDQHMHPRWQVRILSDLRLVFPRLSFVVTTHSPLTLISAEDGEIVMLRRPPDGPIEARQIDIPKGLRVDQVLTGSWFGLATTLHPDVIDKLDRHRRMLHDGVRAGDPTRLTLEAELRQQLGSFADTSMERLTQEVAAESTSATPSEPPTSGGQSRIC